MTTYHISVDLAGAVTIMETLAHRGPLTAHQKKTLADWRERMETGQRTITTCPTPAPHGFCPGHETGGQS